MSKYTVEFTRRANMQIRSIFSYIADDNKGAALRMVDMLEAKALQLEDTPFMGVPLLEEDYPLLPSGYRRLTIMSYNMYYRVEGQMVFITHIVHHRRNQGQALAE